MAQEEPLQPRRPVVVVAFPVCVLERVLGAVAVLRRVLGVQELGLAEGGEVVSAEVELHELGEAPHVPKPPDVVPCQVQDAEGPGVLESLQPRGRPTRGNQQQLQLQQQGLSGP